MSEQANRDKVEEFGSRLTGFEVENRGSKMFVDPGGAGRATLAASEWTQSPDAADRNLAYLVADEHAGRGVQSPDALERNAAVTTFGSGVRDVAPVWIGEYTPEGTWHAAPIEDSPEAFQSADGAAPSADGDLQQ